MNITPSETQIRFLLPKLFDELAAKEYEAGVYALADGFTKLLIGTLANLKPTYTPVNSGAIGGKGMNVPGKE
jgi:hypothetical protein